MKLKDDVYTTPKRSRRAAPQPPLASREKEKARNSADRDSGLLDNVLTKSKLICPQKLEQAVQKCVLVINGPRSFKANALWSTVTCEVITLLQGITSARMVVMC